MKCDVLAHYTVRTVRACNASSTRTQLSERLSLAYKVELLPVLLLDLKHRTSLCLLQAFTIQNALSPLVFFLFIWNWNSSALVVSGSDIRRTFYVFRHEIQLYFSMKFNCISA